MPPTALRLWKRRCGRLLNRNAMVLLVQTFTLALLLPALHLKGRRKMSEVLLADLKEWAESYDAVEIGADGVLYMAIHHIEKLIERNKQLEAALRVAAGYISTKEGHTDQHPEDVYDWIVSAALGEKKDG